MINQEQLVDYLKNITVIELRGLITTLEDELGVKLPVAPVTNHDLGFTDHEEEQTEFNIVLQGYEKSKVAVIKLVRQITGLGLKDAKTAVEQPPYIVKEYLDKDSAEAMAKQFRAVDAIVDIL